MNTHKRTIYIYGVSGIQLLALTASAARVGADCKQISDTQTSLTLEQILSGKDFPPCPPLPLGGKFALMEGFDGEELEGAAAIDQVVTGVVKAVPTEHNRSWHFSALCSQILKESRAINQKK